MSSLHHNPPSLLCLLLCTDHGSTLEDDPTQIFIHIYLFTDINAHLSREEVRFIYSASKILLLCLLSDDWLSSYLEDFYLSAHSICVILNTGFGVVELEYIYV